MIVYVYVYLLIRAIYHTLFLLQTGNMVSYMLSGFYIPRDGGEGEYKIQITYMRPYYLSGAEIIFFVILHILYKTAILKWRRDGNF